MQEVEYVVRRVEITRFGLAYWHPAFLVMCPWTGHLIAPESRVFSPENEENESQPCEDKAISCTDRPDGP